MQTLKLTDKHAFAKFWEFIVKYGKLAENNQLRNWLLTNLFRFLPLPDLNVWGIVKQGLGDGAL